MDGTKNNKKRSSPTPIDELAKIRRKQHEESRNKKRQEKYA